MGCAVSRGPGRVQRAILDTLARVGPLGADVLALYASSSPGSVRRALRTLKKRRAVCFLGFARHGVGLWCLPSQEAEARAHLLEGDRLARVSAVMGPRFARSLARSLRSML